MTSSNEYEFRSITASELKEYQRLVQYVFADDISDEDLAEFESVKPEWTTCAFHRNTLVATSAGYPFKMRFNGFGIPVDGVTDVGTLPNHRRRGLVRRLISDRLRQAYEANQLASILWASMGAIYQRFGYGMASTILSCRFDPRIAGFQFDIPTKGYISMYDRGEGLPIVKAVHRRFIEKSTLMLHRSALMWDLKWRKKGKSYCAVHFNEADEPDGYIIYKTHEWKQRPRDEVGPDQEMNIIDRAWLSIDAYRSLWEYTLRHDLVGRVNFDGAPDDPAWSLLMEPRAIQPRVYDGLWLRVVNLLELLQHRLYSLEGACRFAILEDDLCPWNTGVYHLETDGSQSNATKVSGGSVDFTITPNGIASLIAGNTSLSSLARIGRAEIHKPENVGRINAMFATNYAPFCPDGF